VLQYSGPGTIHHAAGTVHVVLLIRQLGIVHMVQCPCVWYWSSTAAAAAGSLPRAVTMSDDTEAAALRARLEAIVKEAEDVEAQAATARCRVQATCLLLEESKAAALEQTATTARQCVPSSSSSASSPVATSQLLPTASSTYEDTVVARLHLQAAAVLNVRQLVNIVLDSSTNYVS
jgi:hypothetical protein